MLAELLSKVTTSYAFESAKAFAGSTFGNFVRHDLAVEAKKSLFGSGWDLKVKASVGAGNWASVPWLAFFDPLETDTATRGCYVVFLINSRDESFTLSLNQGTTAVYQEFGQKRGRDVLKRRATDMTERVADLVGDFSTEPINLASEDDLPLGYMAGHAFGRTYPAFDVSEEVLQADLRTMLTAYRGLIDRGGLHPTDLMHDQVASTSIEETRRYALSRRIERSASVRLEVLGVRGSICEGCGLDPKRDYGYDGRAQNIPLDVHHSSPLFALQEGETRRYSVPEDFLVLCPTCHRMIHKQDDPSDIETLRSRIRFKHMREGGF